MFKVELPIDWVWKFGDGSIGIGPVPMPTGPMPVPFNSRSHQAIVRTPDGVWHHPPIKGEVGRRYHPASVEEAEEYLRFLGERPNPSDKAVATYAALLVERGVTSEDLLRALLHAAEV